MFRQAYQADYPNDSPEHAQSVLDGVVATWCQGKNVSAHDKILHARGQLEMGGLTGQPLQASECAAAYQTLKDAGAITSEWRSDDPAKPAAVALTVVTAKCFARAGDCAGAFKAYSELNAMNFPKATDLQRHKTFASIVPECKDK
jgi:hypothetical protein